MLKLHLLYLCRWVAAFLALGRCPCVVYSGHELPKSVVFLEARARFFPFFPFLSAFFRPVVQPFWFANAPEAPPLPENVYRFLALAQTVYSCSQVPFTPFYSPYGQWDTDAPVT